MPSPKSVLEVHHRLPPKARRQGTPQVNQAGLAGIDDVAVLRHTLFNGIDDFLRVGQAAFFLGLDNTCLLYTSPSPRDHG